MLTSASIVILCLAAFVAPSYAAEPNNAVDAQAIAAYEKLKGKFGFVMTGPNGCISGFVPMTPGPAATPAFKLVGCQDATLAKLPAVAVPFGLDLSGTQVSAAGLKFLKDVKNLTSLNLNGCGKVTDAGLKELKDLKDLKDLSLHFSLSFTDAGLKELKGLKNLNSLTLANTKTTDAALKDLKELKNLTALNIAGTKVTDKGVKDLKELKNLKYLTISGTKITDASGLDMKQKAETETGILK